MKKKANPQKRKPGAPRANKGEAVRDLTKGRICSICGLYKDREHFFGHPSGFNGLLPRCKDCSREYGRTDRAVAVKKARYDNRRENNQCVKCGSTELVGNSIMCSYHWFQDKAVQRADGTKGVDAIREIWDRQGGCCFYTGEVLLPGVNASLDHRIPRSKGGSSEPSNLQWTTNQINMIKNNMTHEEFVELCHNIASKFR